MIPIDVIFLMLVENSVDNVDNSAAKHQKIAHERVK